MGRGNGRGCLIGCITRLSSLVVICVVLAATAFFGGRLLWVPDWRAAPPDPAAVQAFTQRIASVALGRKITGPVEFAEAEANAFLTVKHPSDPVRVSFGEERIRVDAVTRPWGAARTFLPESWNVVIRSFRLFVSLEGRPMVEDGVLSLAPSSLTIGRQPLPIWCLTGWGKLTGKRLPEFPVPAAVRAVEAKPGRITITLR
jgi:hypothetical protein